MRTSLLSRLGLAGFCALLLFSHKAVGAADNPAITAAIRAEDPRLERRVSVNAYRLYLGELLETLSAQTGIDVSASDRDGAAGERLSVSFARLPVADALNAINALLSTKRAPFLCQREKSGEKPVWTYRLLRSSASRHYRESLEDALQKDFEQEVLAKVAFARLSAQERGQAERENPALHLDPRTLAGLSIAANLLDQETLLTTLRGTPVRLPAERAGAAAQQFFAGEKARVPVGPGVAAWQPPMMLGFERGKHDESDLAPKFYLTLERGGDGNTEGSKEFIGLAGGKPLEKIWREKTREDWHYPLGEKDAPPLSEVRLTTSGADDSPDDDPCSAFASLRKFSSAAAIPVLARISHQSRFNVSPIGKTPTEYLNALRSSGLDYKWINTALLVTDYGWLNEAEAQKLSWEVVKHLRERTRETVHHGLTIDDYLYVALHLMPPQIESLWQGNNPWRYDYWGDMRQVSRLQPLLNLLASDEPLRQRVLAEGTPVVPLSALPPTLQRWYQTATEKKAASFRVQVDRGSAKEGTTGEIVPFYHATFSLLSDKGDELQQERIVSMAWPPPKPKMVSSPAVVP